MYEQERLEDLMEYHIMDTPPEKELDELVEIASAICNTPISLISLLDDNRQWFKAVKGLNVIETPRKSAFCHYALKNSKEVLVVEDSFLDSRFRNNPLVLSSPYIRFYAGAPLKTPSGNVLGTLCVIDDKPRHITENQKKALQLLAKKVMDFLNARKLLIEQAKKIEFNSARLKKLTDQVPGTIFQIEMSFDRKLSVPFISHGITKLSENLDIHEVRKNPELLLKVIHPGDVFEIKKSMLDSFTNLTMWDTECRVRYNKNIMLWYRGTARPEKKEDGRVVWYGMLQDISYQKEYEKTLEQISYDISHVLRKPVSTMQGLTSSIQNEKLDEKLLKKYSGYIRVVSDELDRFTRKLNRTYTSKKKGIYSSNPLDD